MSPAITGRPLRMALLAALVGCSDAPEAPPEPDAASAEAAAEQLLEQQDAAAPAPPSGAPPEEGAAPHPSVATDGAELASPVQPELKWEGVGNLHKSFFSDPAVVQQLSADLTGEIRSPAPIAIRYDSKNFVGQIRLQLDPGALARPVGGDGDTIRLQDLAPLTTALARYRSSVSGRFDLRVESFGVGIESIRPGRACVFGVAGKPPPDGRLVSPCVEINGQERCGTPTAEGVRFSPDAAKDVRACLDG